MAASPLQKPAVVTIVLAFGILALAMATGGDVFLIVVGLVLAAVSMEMFQRPRNGRRDED